MILSHNMKNVHKQISQKFSTTSVNRLLWVVISTYCIFDEKQSTELIGLMNNASSYKSEGYWLNPKRNLFFHNFKDHSSLSELKIGQ